MTTVRLPAAGPAGVARRRHAPPPARPRQRGAALLTAMILVALVATLSSAMVWQQWRAVQVEAAERSRLQSAWILSGALDWSRLILREDARSQRPTALTEPWATPLAEARLSTFLAADKDRTDDAPEAFLAGGITDAQARFNLLNVVDGDKVSPEGVAVLQRLCTIAGVADGLATQLAERLRDALATAQTQTGAAPLVPQTTAQIAWLGVDADTLRRLTPLVTVLPVITPVNVNTASREVLAAAAGIDLGSADRIVQARQRTPFRDTGSLAALLPAGTTLNARQADVRSSFFEVTGRLRLGERVLYERSLVQRRGLDVVTLRRERIGPEEAGW